MKPSPPSTTMTSASSGRWLPYRCSRIRSASCADGAPEATSAILSSSSATSTSRVLSGPAQDREASRDRLRRRASPWSRGAAPRLRAQLEALPRPLGREVVQGVADVQQPRGPVEPEAAVLQGGPVAAGLQRPPPTPPVVDVGLGVRPGDRQVDERLGVARDDQLEVARV